jgi:hypothetical protein
MDRKLYDKFYGNIIKKSIDDFIQYNNSSKDRKFILDARDDKGGIYEEYQTQRALFRILCKTNNPLNEEEDTDNLCRHKVCACLTAAIIKCRPLYVLEGFPKEKDFKLSVLPTHNEHLALSVGLSLLRAFILADKKEVKRHQYFEGTDIFVPPIFRYNKEENKDTFDTEMIWTLFTSNVINGISLPLLASLFFFLDRYHETRHELNELQTNYEELKIATSSVTL